MSESITFSQFLDVDIRVGTILSADSFPEAHQPAYKLQIDFGTEIGRKQSSAQITDCYELDTLVGRQILAVVNFPPKQVGPFMSEVLVLGLADEAKYIHLIGPDGVVPNGARLL
jgi:tRNA-binding protein